MNDLYQKRKLVLQRIGNTPSVVYTRKSSVYHSYGTLKSYASNQATMSGFGKRNSEYCPINELGYRIKPLSRFFQNFQGSVSDYMMNRNGRSWINDETRYLRKRKILIKQLIQKGMRNEKCQGNRMF